MKKIDGKKYINKEDYNKAMSKSLADIGDRLKKDLGDTDPTLPLMLSMLIAGELINVGCILFEDDK